ncbi:hypothetical protein [Rufibacter roseus]|uniref:Uncharacterized protein n=1 Tax=Rufibacter roseus TaxID=1567108 RepID=A0ABW2DJ43_9BACT|nr:hypothetical protein [Rufibacter roseus]
MKKPFLLFSFLFISLVAFGQRTDYGKLLEQAKTGESITTKTKDSESTITYLGTIKNEKGKVVFFVVKEFIRIQAAKQKHGRSTILFFDNQKNKIAEYRVNLPDELPKKLIKNILYFTAKDSKGNRIEHQQEISITLPEYICVSSEECFNKS